MVTEVPLAIWLERVLHSGTSNIVTSIFMVGLPEEFAKAIPIIAVAVAVRRRITPADYLFLGAVSGLVFGASEAEHYLASGVGLVGATRPRTLWPRSSLYGASRPIRSCMPAGRG